MNNSESVVGMVALAVIGIAIVCIPIYSAVWAYGDAEQRGKPGCLVAILVLFFSWPLGLILWIVFRPEPRGRL